MFVVIKVGDIRKKVMICSIFSALRNKIIKTGGLMVKIGRHIHGFKTPNASV